ncbi:hypothetical protein HYU95_02620 [Candidatus Daviesbacteria bacterium]|nr:hypothetical protein [Candidatus Daviesbacteria bacterium]
MTFLLTLPPTHPSCSAADFAELVIAPNPPEITSLEIGNNPNRDTFTTTFEGSGRQTGLEGGKGWYNPMTVKLNATKGTGDIKLYVSAFYDKRQGQTTDQQALSNLTAIEGQINADPAIGFMLAYAAQNCANQTDNCLVDNTGFGFTIGNYYAFVKGSGWVDISSEIINGYPIYDNLGQSILTVFPVSKGNYFAQWKVRYYKDFGSKKMYTPGFVIDSNNLSSFQSDIPPN